MELTTNQTKTQVYKEDEYKLAKYQNMELTTHHTNQVRSILTWTYGLLAIAAGADKFMHLLTNWNKYLAPVIAKMLPVSVGTFMNMVGGIEIVAGILVLAKPRAGSIVVSLWLFGIAINLLLTGQYYDVAVRDFVMSIGAFCLFQITNRKSSLVFKSK
jgi:hypothetical protein